MSDYLLSSQEVDYWRNVTRSADSVTTLLRQLVGKYQFNKHQISSAAAEIFEDYISGEDRQVLWKWRLSESDEGFSDEEVNKLLAHLLLNM